MNKNDIYVNPEKSGKPEMPVVPLTEGEQAESTVFNHEAFTLSREELVVTREVAVQLREGEANLRDNIANVREDAFDVREHELKLREFQATLYEKEMLEGATLKAASDRLIIMLQQANAHLVTASIETLKMAEQVKVAKDQLAYLAHHDVLTGLPNRILLLDRLNSAIELASRKGWQLALMFLDLDRFKHINDSLGHVIGDQLLQSVAECLTGCARHSDTISRQGGDEFVILLPCIERTGDAELCAQKLIAAIRLHQSIAGHNIHIGVSIGISIYPDDAQDAETLIKNADTAMYCAKESRRTKYKFFEPEMNARAIQRHSIEVSLHLALKNQEFSLYYQPKVDLRSGLIVGVEALIRWQHPVLGEMLPTQFLPIAEECGLILPIGRWVLREACLQAQAWGQAGIPPISVSVNTSALEFHDMGFLENIRSTLEETGLEPRHLELELTETILMQDAEFTYPVLQGLADLGVKLAIDDFGIGYSSLNYLKQFPINTLKVDQSFVHKMTNNPDDASIVSAVINLGKSLKLRVIAEGVETPEQHAFLVAEDCDEVQGYYFGLPMVAESLTTLLQTGLSPVPSILLVQPGLS